MIRLPHDMLPSRRAPAPAVQRDQLQYLRLKLPALKGKALTEALRLQLLAFGGDSPHHAHAWQVGSDGQVSVWLWAVDPGPQALSSARAWPAPVLERPGAGLRLLRRGPGAEGQQWKDGELLHTRWWPALPSAEEWSRFVRGAGLDPAAHPCPQAEDPQPLSRAPRGWRRASDLPVEAPRGQWLRLASPAIVGALIFAALGAQLQTRRQLDRDRARLEAIKGERQAALDQRSAYESLRADFDRLSALAPAVSQLELLAAVAGSGIFDVPAATEAMAPPGMASQDRTFTAAAPDAAPAPATPSPSLSEWDYRAGRLKLTLEIPEGALAMLDSTRRIEKLPLFTELRIGLESTNTALTLNMRVAQAPRAELP